MEQELKTQEIGNLTGRLLISSPLMDTQSYFHKSVIYVIQHNEQGAIGVLVNHPVMQANMAFYVKSANDSEQELLNLDAIDTYIGGPIDIEKALILHSNDQEKGDNNISLSYNVQVLQDIIRGHGPKMSLLALGYCSWTKDQLEQEIKDNYWFVLPANNKVVFEVDSQDKWVAALESLNINAYNFSVISGNC
jgi:putative transcriptional regulator